MSDKTLIIRAVVIDSTDVAFRFHCGWVTSNGDGIYHWIPKNKFSFVAGVPDAIKISEYEAINYRLIYDDRTDFWGIIEDENVV